MNNEALGMVETKGLVSAIEAADAMTKAANVMLVGYEKNWIRTCNCNGSRGCWSSKSGCRCWSCSCKKCWRSDSQHVIPRPHIDTEKILPKTL